MLSLNEVKTGMAIDFDNKPYIVMHSQHAKVGRGGAILRTKIKDLISGAVIEKTFKGNEKIETADIDRKKYQYLYNEGEIYHFMEPTTFEQISIDKTHIGEQSQFLSEGIQVQILFYENKPLAIELPIKMEFEITYTEPGLRGDTKSSTALKPAKVNTGAQIQVPLFINIGDKIIVDTRTGKYVERA